MFLLFRWHANRLFSRLQGPFQKKGKCYTGVDCYSQGCDGKVASVSLETYAMITSATADRSCARDDMNLYILQL